MNQMKKFLMITTIATLLLGIASSTLSLTQSHTVSLSSFQITSLPNGDDPDEELF